MGKREELQSQLKDLRERLSNVKGDRDSLSQGSGNSAAYNQQVSMGMFDEDADLARRATELKEQVAAVAWSAGSETGTYGETVTVR